MPEHRPYFIAKEKGNLIVIRLGGVINADTMPQWRDMVDQIVEKHEIYKRSNLRILVDYGQVIDVDSSTIANILDQISENKKHQHVIGFINVPEEFKDIVEIHKLADKVKIFRSEKEAIKALSRQTP